MSDTPTTLEKKNFFIPTTMSHLAKLMGSYPDALLMGGGIHCMSSGITAYHKANTLISVARVADLKKIYRNEQYIELGSSVRVRDLLTTGWEHLPAVLKEGFSEIGPESIKNWATIGGMLCIKEQRLDCFVPLCVLGTEIELRTFYPDGRKKNQRWISLSDFLLPDGHLDLAKGEILTRLRIPNEQWNLQMYHKVGHKYTTQNTTLVIAILAKIEKAAITDFRLYLGNGKTALFRNPLLENSLVGYSYPIKRSQAEALGQMLSHFCKNMPKNFESLATHATRQILIEFLSGIYE